MTVVLRADSSTVGSGFTASFDCVVCANYSASDDGTLAPRDCTSIAAGGADADADAEAEADADDDEGQATVCAGVCDSTENCIGYTVEDEGTDSAAGCDLVLSTLGGAQPERSQHTAGTFVELAADCDSTPRACRVGDTWVAGMDDSDAPRSLDGRAECESPSRYDLSYSEGWVDTVSDIDGACFSSARSRWAPLAAGSCSCAPASRARRASGSTTTSRRTNGTRWAGRTCA
jgi:hypothetical protein